MAGKYMRLEKYLRNLPVSQREVKLGFEQIDIQFDAPVQIQKG